MARCGEGRAPVAARAPSWAPRCLRHRHRAAPAFGAAFSEQHERRLPGSQRGQFRGVLYCAASARGRNGAFWVPSRCLKAVCVLWLSGHLRQSLPCAGRRGNIPCPGRKGLGEELVER